MSPKDPGREGAAVRGTVGTTARAGWRAHPVRTAIALFAAMLGVAVLVFVVWALTPYQADDAARDALWSGQGVTVTQAAEATVFDPGGEVATGLVLYPGGRVEASAYAPLARAVAEQGHLVVLQPMPLNLAVFASGRAARAIEAHPQVRTWAVGGHSLGGAMAAEFAAREPALVDGLVLLAAYPASVDLSGSSLAVLTMRGTADGLVSAEDIEQRRSMLPPGSVLIEIDGGNHAGFGSYGPQRGDGASALPAGEQARIAADAVARFLTSLAE